jgi:NADH-quinone oxidoreductase subunit N
MLAQNLWEGIDVSGQLWAFSPLIALVCTMLAVVVCPIIVGRGPRIIGSVVVAGIVITFILAFQVAHMVSDGGITGLTTETRSGMLVADNMAVWFQGVLLIFLLGITALWWIGSAPTERDAPEFFVLLLGSALGMCLMVSTSNLLMVVVAIETASLPSYALVGFNKRDRIGAEASLKYMVFGAICAALMLYGVSLLYGVCGSLEMSAVAEHVVRRIARPPFPVLTATALFCLLAGIAFKVSAVPFHFWCPDAFEGAKIEVTTWLSVVSKAAGLLLLTRFVLHFCAAVQQEQAMNLLSPFAWTLGILASITCTVGNFAAYRQQSVKRLLAYSSIAHAGYMMMTTAVFLYPGVEGSNAGVSALLFYVLIYMVMNLGAFGVTAFVVWGTGSDRIESFTGLGRRAPWLAVPMIICLMSLLGIPPFAGFVAKWWLLIALGKLGGTTGWLGYLGWVLVVVAVINTLISLYYYVRVVIQMALRDERAEPVESPISGLSLVNVCAVLLLVMFVFAQPIKKRADAFAQNLKVQTLAVTDQAQDTVAWAVEQSD